MEPVEAWQYGTFHWTDVRPAGSNAMGVLRVAGWLTTADGDRVIGMMPTRYALMDALGADGWIVPAEADFSVAAASLPEGVAAEVLSLLGPGEVLAGGYRGTAVRRRVRPRRDYNAMVEPPRV